MRKKIDKYFKIYEQKKLILKIFWMKKKMEIIESIDFTNDSVLK